jgi:hypothetical protein
MTSRKSRRRGHQRAVGGGELSFVVDITSFTDEGFVGASSYEGETVDLMFDEGEDGLFLNPEMAERMGAKKGTSVYVVVEGDTTAIVQMQVAAIGRRVRISNPKVYHAVGGEGGAVIRVRRN